MSPKRLSILDVPFDVLNLSSAVDLLASSRDKKKQLFCVTPNPEICLEAMKNRAFKKVLKEADLSIPDGFGILWAARYLSGKKNIFRWLWTLLTPWKTSKLSPIRSRVTGTDLMRRFCKEYPDRKIFLLGASKEVNEKLAKKLNKSGMKIVGNYSGNPSEKLELIIRSMIQASGAEVLFVAFGAPNQELWIARNRKYLKSVRVAVGVGGAFDFLAGKRTRAPKWMQNMGLEWLFRLLIEPSRVKRIFRATLIFPWKVHRFGEK